MFRFLAISHCWFYCISLFQCQKPNGRHLSDSPSTDVSVVSFKSIYTVKNVFIDKISCLLKVFMSVAYCIFYSLALKKKAWKSKIYYISGKEVSKYFSHWLYIILVFYYSVHFLPIAMLHRLRLQWSS